MNKDTLKQIAKNAIIFFAIFLIINTVFKTFIQKEPETTSTSGSLTIEAKNTYPRGKLVTATIKNDTAEKITIKNECPEEPLTVLNYKEDKWEQINANPSIACEDTKDTVIESGKSQKIDYTNWNHALFGNLGKYKLAFTYNEKTYESNEFVIEEENFVRLLWTRMLYQPIYNTLIFISSKAGQSLGLGIIFLTIIIRLILLLPSQQALKQQRKMQLIQPKLEEIKKQHKGDQQKIAQETMSLWKEHKVNPFGSFLPLFVQFPVLIALFYVIKGGLNPDNTHFLYEFLKNVTLSDIQTNFLGILELTKRNIFWLPLIVGALQFIQMKLSIAKKKKNDNGKKEPKNEMAMANNMMIYFMPVMIAVFAASLPAGVGIYWGTSTLVGIAQQLIVNKEVAPKVKVKDVKEKKK